jgi:two-component system chemotaxis response regulator CheB
VRELPQPGVPLRAIVIGGSAGALAVVRTILAAIQEPPALPLVVVLHVREGRQSLLAEVLASGAALPVKEPEDKQLLEAGSVYIAPPGYHLLIEDERSLALSIDAPEHYSRPSIDVLFESAARVFGPALLAVLLSGASADGAQGLVAVARAGGLTLVQDPATSNHSAMPAAGLARLTPTMVLGPAELASTIAFLAASAARRSHV